jgi:hypothetical protein
MHVNNVRTVSRAGELCCLLYPRSTFSRASPKIFVSVCSKIQNVSRYTYFLISYLLKDMFVGWGGNLGNFNLLLCFFLFGKFRFYKRKPPIKTSAFHKLFFRKRESPGHFICGGFCSFRPSS